MDSTYIAYSGMILSILSCIYGIINHKKIVARSPCCRDRLIFSIDVDNTSPVRINPEPPPHQPSTSIRE